MSFDLQPILKGESSRTPAPSSGGFRCAFCRRFGPADLGAASIQRSLSGGGLSQVLPRRDGVRRCLDRHRRKGWPDHWLVALSRLRRPEQRGRDRLDVPGPVPLGRPVQWRNEASHASTCVSVCQTRRLSDRPKQPPFAAGCRKDRRRSGWAQHRTRPAERALFTRSPPRSSAAGPSGLPFSPQPRSAAIDDPPWRAVRLSCSPTAGCSSGCDANSLG